jgi:hypothetical protein
MQIRYPINIFSSCLCLGNGNKKIPLAPKNIKSGMTTKNGINFFPEEFLPLPKKGRKLDDDILV